MWARRYEADAALGAAGYPEQSGMSVLDRTEDVLIELIKQRVERRMQEVFRPEDVQISPPPQLSRRNHRASRRLV